MSPTAAPNASSEVVTDAPETKFGVVCRSKSQIKINRSSICCVQQSVTSCRCWRTSINWTGITLNTIKFKNARALCRHLFQLLRICNRPQSSQRLGAPQKLAGLKIADRVYTRQSQSTGRQRNMPAAHSGLISHIVERPKYQLLLLHHLQVEPRNHTKQALYLTFGCIFGKMSAAKTPVTICLDFERQHRTSGCKLNPTCC